MERMIRIMRDEKKAEEVKPEVKPESVVKPGAKVESVLAQILGLPKVEVVVEPPAPAGFDLFGVPKVDSLPVTRGRKRLIRVPGVVERESEKAILLRSTVDRNKLGWFPKKLIYRFQDVYWAPLWLVDAKAWPKGE